jgi:antitoxin MazE
MDKVPQNVYPKLCIYILEVVMHVARWGNSLAVRIPAKTVKALSLKEGDKVDMALMVVEGEDAESAARRAEALERLRSLRGTLTQNDLLYDRKELYRR